jgi:hypothetical protein
MQSGRIVVNLLADDLSVRSIDAMRDHGQLAQEKREKRRRWARRFVAVLLACFVGGAALMTWSTWSQSQRRAIADTLTSAGAVLRYDSTCPDWFLDTFGETAAYAFFPQRATSLSTSPAADSEAPVPSHLNDESLKLLKWFPRLESLDLRGSDVTDEGLKHLNSLKRLNHLDLRETSVTEHGVAWLERTLPGAEIKR